MDKPSPDLYDLARRLLAHEAARQTTSDSAAPESIRLIETLRASLTRLTGADGFVALLRRALALASAEVPALHSVQLTAEGRLAGLEALAPDVAVVLAAHLFGLLVTFIGQPLTLRLVREAFPGALLDE